MPETAVFRETARIQISFNIHDHREVVSAADLSKDLLRQHLGGFVDDGFEGADSELAHVVGAEPEDGAVGSQDESVRGAGRRRCNAIFWWGKMEEES